MAPKYWSVCVCCHGVLKKIPTESAKWSTSECKRSLILTFTRQQLAKTVSKFLRCTTCAQRNALSEMHAPTMCWFSAVYCLYNVCGSPLWNVFSEFALSAKGVTPCPLYLAHLYKATTGIQQLNKTILQIIKESYFRRKVLCYSMCLVSAWEIVVQSLHRTNSIGSQWNIFWGEVSKGSCAWQRRGTGMQSYMNVKYLWSSEWRLWLCHSQWLDTKLTQQQTWGRWG